MNFILTRLLLSALAGFLLGLERQVHRQPAGLKTHILICLGSTLLMLVSIELGGDPGRVAAQVVSGIGFLGGGAIIRQGFNIKGLTTAATVWVSAAIGLALGLGYYLPAFLTLGLILVTLVLMERFETTFFPAKNIKTLYLVFENKDFDYPLLERELSLLKISVGNLDVSRTIESERIKLSLQIHAPPHVDFNTLTRSLQKAGKLIKLEITANEKPIR